MKKLALNLILLLSMAASAHASMNGGGSGLEVETAFQKIGDFLRGPLAFYVGTIGMVLGAMMFVFGRGHMAFGLILSVIGGSGIIMSADTLLTLFGVNSTLLPVLPVILFYIGL